MTATELINIIHPEHDRSSCSDEDTQNGFYLLKDEWQDNTDTINQKHLPRCRRCALLEIARKEIETIEENLAIIKEYFR